MNMRTESACLRVLVLFPLLLGAGLGARAQENCCTREVWTAPFTIPSGESQEWGNFFSTGVNSPLHGKLPGIDCPPLEIWLNEYKVYGEYRFVGEVTTEGFTQIDHDGHLRGTFVARVRLIDPDHGNAVLREARPISWTGLLTDGLNHMVFNYEPSTDSLNPSWVDPSGELGKQFSDILTLIYDYERKPQKCRVTLPEGSGDVVRAGQTITVTVREIIAHKGLPPQPWQRVLVKVERGKILNAETKWDDYYVFRAGKDATVSIEYQAPDDCKAAKETLKVFNTCYKKEGGEGSKEDELASRTFDIACDRWDVTVTYTEQMTFNRNADQGLTQTSRNYSITLKGRVHLKERRGSEVWYESDSASIELADSFSRLDVVKGGKNPDLKTNAAWGATRRGQVPMKMRVRFAPKFHNYSVQWLPWQGDPIVYKGTYQWSGWPAPYVAPPEGAFEFTCREIANALPEPPPGQQPFAEGQTVLKGQESWRDPATSVEAYVNMPEECTLPPNAFTPNALTLSFVIDPLSNPYAKTRSWEVRRPQ